MAHTSTHRSTSGGASSHEAPVGAPGPRRDFSVWLATVGGVGDSPLAPGTLGSALGVGLFLVLEPLGPALCLLTILTLGCLGVWASDRAERFFERHDDPRIVIDELAGQLIALMPLLGLPAGAGADALRVPLLVTGFVAFRLFDIWKPGPVRWAEERFRGGLGVMADDVVAGVLAAIPIAAVTYAGSIGGLSLA